MSSKPTDQQIDTCGVDERKQFLSASQHNNDKCDRIDAIDQRKKATVDIENEVAYRREAHGGFSLSLDIRFSKKSPPIPGAVNTQICIE